MSCVAAGACLPTSAPSAAASACPQPVGKCDNKLPHDYATFCGTIIAGICINGQRRQRKMPNKRLEEVPGLQPSSRVARPRQEAAAAAGRELAAADRRIKGRSGSDLEWTVRTVDRTGHQVASDCRSDSC